MCSTIALFNRCWVIVRLRYLGTVGHHRCTTLVHHVRYQCVHMYVYVQECVIVYVHMCVHVRIVNVCVLSVKCMCVRVYGKE